MDSVDVRIFLEMYSSSSGFTAYSKKGSSAAVIADKLKLDEKTVRTRVRKMVESGFIKYFQVVPNLALFGLRSVGTYRFEALNLATKASVVKKVSGIKQILECFDYLGNYVGGTFAGENSRDVKAAAEVLAARFELDLVELGERAVREPAVRLDASDWKIVRKLRYDARIKAKQIADELGLTARMVEYRMEKLRSSGAFLTHPVINWKGQSGLVFFELEVSVENSKQDPILRRLRHEHEETLWSFSTPSAGRIAAGFFGLSLGEPEEVALRVREYDGVKTSSSFILKEAVEPEKPNWIDELIVQAIEARITGPREDRTLHGPDLRR